MRFGIFNWIYEVSDIIEEIEVGDAVIIVVGADSLGL